MAGRCGLKTAFFHVVILSCPEYEFRPLCSKHNYCELIPTKVVICLNPFNPKSDQHLFSPNNVTTFSREKVMRIYKIITKEELVVSKRVSKEQYRVFSLRPIFRPVVIFKSTYYYFIRNSTAWKTCFSGLQKWTPWTVEWGGRNCERGLQGHSWLDSAKVTLNCFRATCTRIQTNFWNWITFHPDSCRRGLKDVRAKIF